jgi:hypothetical protein
MFMALLLWSEYEAPFKHSVIRHKSLEVVDSVLLILKL